MFSAPTIHTLKFSTSEKTFTVSQIELLFKEPWIEFYEAQSITPKMLLYKKELFIAFGSIVSFKSPPKWNEDSDNFRLFGALSPCPEALYNGFFLPKILIHASKMLLSIKHTDSKTPTIQEFQALYHTLTFNYLKPKPQHSCLNAMITPNKEEWTKLIKQAKTTFTSTTLNKVVLSRKLTLNYSHPLSLRHILHHLTTHKESTLFCLSTNNVHFVGSTPELLVHVKHNTIHSEALAGTADKQHVNTLLKSHKIDEEFTYVSHHIESIFQRHSTNVQIKPRTTQKAGTLFHVKQRFSGSIPQQFSLSALIQHLHPTPALGGYPKKEALNFISNEEPYKRGNYSHPIGMLSKDESILYIAIRCAQLDHNILHLYSGAGIVKNSDPLLEWKELNQKLYLWTPFLPPHLQPNY